MTVLLPPFLADAVPGWLAARRHAVPPAMVDDATARRSAGDWRGACAAAGFVVRVDPDEVRDRYGAETAGRVEEDLRHLVPDLIRWHLPREPAGGLGRVLPNLPIVLARYGAGQTAPALWVRTPVHLERPLRPELRFGPLNPTAPEVRGERWDEARYLWDARATDGLRHRLGGGDRVAFFHRDGRPRTADELPATAPDGDPVALTEWVLARLDADRFEEAWAAAGVEVDLTDREDRWIRRPADLQRNAMVPALVAAMRDRLATAPPAAWTENGTVTFVPYEPPRWSAMLIITATTTDAGIRFTGRLANARTAPAAEVVPRATWQRFPDLELLRTGRLERSGLHPLVRAALFPDEPDPDGYRTRPVEPAPDAVRVRCRGTWHRIGWRDGQVDPHDHTSDEVRRERTMRALGGVVPRCFTVTESWRGADTGPTPRALRTLRRDASAAIAHGDTDAFLTLLDQGVDPAGIRNRRRRTPLHLAAHLSGDPATLVRRLVGAGLDVDAKDAIGRTPLGTVLFDGGSAALVRALLDAGADPTRLDDMGCSPAHLLRSADADTILPWLLDAGVDLEATDEYGRTPLMAQVISLAPPATMHAMLKCGADPRAVEEYSEQSIADMIDEDGFDDLGFLVAAAGGGDDD